MKITLLGSGDTIGTPVPACECPTCQDENPKTNRTRFWILIEDWSERILIDTNPDLHLQCVRHRLRLETITHVFVTHTHSDHINGMGEFHIRPTVPTRVYNGNDPITLRNMEYFRYLEWENILCFENFETGEIIGVGESIKVTPIELNHEFPCHGFIVENGKHKIGIITDSSHVLPKKTEFAIKDCDLLFIDAFSENYQQIENLYRDIHEPIPDPISEMWGHMTIEQSADIVKKSGSHTGVALHISHYSSSHGILVEKYETSSMKIGYDGMEFEL